MDPEERENKYSDVIGIFIEDSELDIDHELVERELEELSSLIKKNAVCVLKNEDGIFGLLYEIGTKEFYKVKAQTINDVNYEIWLDQESSFWNPVDFLLDESLFDETDYINGRLDSINSKLDQLINLIRKTNNNEDSEKD